MNLKNCWIGKGRLTSDPEIRINEKGKKVLFFTIAIDEGTKEKPYTNFQDIVAYEGFAETINKYFAKGDEIQIMGRINNYTTTDRGEKRKRTNVVLESFEFGRKKKNDESKEKNEEDYRYEYGGLDFY